MINPLVKIMVIDGFMKRKEAENLCMITKDLKYDEYEFGHEVTNFNMVPPNANEMFSSLLGTKMEIDEENSGVFRRPVSWIHFESFNATNEWLFFAALTESTTLNIFEHQSGATTALDGYRFNYRNLFEWDLHLNFVLKPGQGILFRPWLFHSFDGGQIQMFKLREM